MAEKKTKKQATEENRTESAEAKRKEIVEDISESGVSKTVAEKEERLDEKEQMPEKSETKPVEKKEDNKTESPKEKQKETESKKEDKKKTSKPKEKKTEAVARGYSLPLSTKKSADMCRFIKGKSVQKALDDVEQVAAMRKPIPFRGEHPHQKGIMSGGYPKKTAEHFIKLLKSLSANADYVGIENPIIAEANANIAQRPFGKFGRVRRKRTHVTIIAKEKSKIKKKKSKKKSTKKMKKTE